MIDVCNHKLSIPFCETIYALAARFFASCGPRIKAARSPGVGYFLASMHKELDDVFMFAAHV
jgi:hypothetical protein